ncbi:MAG: hypothetical protein ACRD3Q_05510 [Terriglobales bacterium]
MAKIRDAGICPIHDTAALKKIAPDTGFVHAEHDLMSCTAIAGTAEKSSQGANSNTFSLQPGTPEYLFELTLGNSFGPQQRQHEIRETVGGHEVFQFQFSDSDLARTDTDSCEYNLPFTGLEFSAHLRVRKFVVGQADQTLNWPERCQVAKSYLGDIADKVLELKKRTNKPENPLTGKDPCATRSNLAGMFPGWTAAAVAYINPYECFITFTKQGESYAQKLDIAWDLDAEPGTGSIDPSTQVQRVQIGGLSGVRSCDQMQCSESMIVKPAEPNFANSATLIRLTLSTETSAAPTQLGQPAPSIPAPSADLVGKATELVISGISS